jgi:hypothetical protein
MSLTKATYSMIEGAPINVLDYGAVGDGTNDDTSAIQLALNTGKTVYFPDGTYKITDTLTVNSGTRKIYGNGNKTVIAPYLSAGKSCFDLTVQAVRFEMDGFYFNLPSGEQSDVLAIKFSSATPANRGNTIRNIWIQGLQKGFTAGDTFARITIQSWNHSFLETNTVGAISINLPNLSNTTFMKDVDIIGGFEYGIFHFGRVFSIRDFNIAGTGTFLMGTSIYVNGSAVGQIETGWIEKLINPGDPGDQPAIYLNAAQAVSINNVNVANGSIYLEDGIGNTINACQFGNNTGGIRTVGFPDYSVNASNQLPLGGDAIAFYRESATGRISVTGYNNEKPKRGYLVQAASVMTTAPTRTNAGLVTLTADTADFLTGTQSQLVTTTATNQGVQFAFAGLIVGQVYTFTCFTKSTTASDVVSLSTSVGSRSGSYPQVNTGLQTDWQMLSVPAIPDGSGNLTVRVRDAIAGSFKIDSAQLWLGYHLDQPVETLP